MNTVYQYLSQLDWERTVEFAANIAVILALAAAILAAIFAWFELRDRRRARESQLLNEFFDRWHSSEMIAARSYLRRKQLRGDDGERSPEKLMNDREALEHLAHIFNFFELLGLMVVRVGIPLDAARPFAALASGYWQAYSDMVAKLRRKWNQEQEWRPWEDMVARFSASLGSS